jgi:hypothetical protein
MAPVFVAIEDGSVETVDGTLEFILICALSLVSSHDVFDYEVV